MKEKIFVFGASGHARVVIDVIERQGLYEIALLADDDPALQGRECYGYPVIGNRERLLRLPDAPRQGIVAIGSNRARGMVAAWLHAHGFTLVTAIHPSAQLGRDVSLGVGTVIMAGAVINSGSRIGRNVIVNTRAGIDHDCSIGDGVHIAPGATLCGTVTVGEESFVCAGATLTPNLTLGRQVIVGAGAVALRDLPDGVTVGGVPARVLQSSKD